MVNAERDIVPVEDHCVHGGLGEAVAAAVSGHGRVDILGVREISRSGTPVQLMAAHGIDAAAIVAAARRLL